MIKHYVIKSTKNRARMVFRYNQNGKLIGYDLLGEYNQKQELFLFEQISHLYEEEKLKVYCEETKLPLQLIQGDLTFDSFWNIYDHKVGKKPRCKKLWEDLPDSEKALAIAYIARYKDKIKAMGQGNPMYPETYLFNQTWHNED